MMSSKIFLSYFLDKTTPLYGGSYGVEIILQREILNGDTSNNKILKFPNHSGTHVDFPNHFFANGLTCEDYPADFWFFNQSELLNVTVPNNNLIDINAIDLLNFDDNIEFLILKTGFWKFRNEEKYWKFNPGLTPQSADVLRNKFKNLKAIGMDFISLTSYQNREIGREAHRCFLGGDKPILLIEDMDLSCLNKSPKSIICLPLLVNGIDGSPISIVAEI